MDDLKKIIESGSLELYVLGLTSEEETRHIEQLTAKHAEIREEISQISAAIEKYGQSHAIAPHATVKPFILASTDYISRIENGEIPGAPPLLNEKSTIVDYKEWLSRKDMRLPADAENIFAKIIGYLPDSITAIVWIKEMSPQEIHHDEHERFLIVEGSCQITIGNKTHNLIPGDYLAIPLHEVHKVKITSAMPCKAILQRVKVL